MIHQNPCQNNNDSPLKFLVKYPLKWQFLRAHHTINWCYNFHLLSFVLWRDRYISHNDSNIHFNQLHFMFVVFVVIVPLLPTTHIELIQNGHIGRRWKKYNKKGGGCTLCDCIFCSKRLNSFAISVKFRIRYVMSGQYAPLNP